MMTALDAGAEDFSEEGGQLRDPDRSPDRFRRAVRQALEEAGIPMARCGGHNDSSDICRTLTDEKAVAEYYRETLDLLRRR